METISNGHKVYQRAYVSKLVWTTNKEIYNFFEPPRRNLAWASESLLNISCEVTAILQVAKMFLLKNQKNYKSKNNNVLHH